MVRVIVSFFVDQILGVLLLSKHTVKYYSQITNYNKRIGNDAQLNHFSVSFLDEYECKMSRTCYCLRVTIPQKKIIIPHKKTIPQTGAQRPVVLYQFPLIRVLDTICGYIVA